ncbi:TonB-dependent siderophore receptor [Herbaspirillum rubrisubalbicans]|uniref:Ligand-gated channel protein n=1 Tax=Herbaspirillum rubrisubalbicans TaxID=80842 RepID=A0ABX9C4U2_9BURK|nr:TonB-dependent siderophore receptor [Herbaspirillum rubrisubalbicans]RAM65268.1 ligand-gated channel protein [Herbaspirillum rubrisubalbicans]
MSLSKPTRMSPMLHQPLIMKLALAQALMSTTALYAQPVQQRFDIPGGPLEDVLTRFAQAADVPLALQAGKLQGLRSPGLAGSYSVEAGFNALLAGSGYRIGKTAAGYVLMPDTGSATPTATPLASAQGSLPTINVSASAESWSARTSSSTTKTDTPLIEVPQSISVVTAERIAALGATTARDALGYTPGVNIAPYGADSRYDWINLRGFDAYSPGFYLDGLPLRNANSFAVWRTENYGIDQIAVLRGPASVLFGQAGPGGVVNVVSKLPSAETQRELQVQLGSNQRRQVGGDFGGAMDADGKLLYRFIGVIRDAEMPAGGMKNDRIYLAPSLTWKISRDTSLTLQASLLRDNGGVYTRTRPLVGSLVPTPIGTTIPSGLHTGNPNFDHFSQNQELLGYRLEHRFDEAVVFRQSARVGHMSVDYHALQQPNFITVDATVPNDPANFQSLSRNLFGSRESATMFSIDNQLQLDFSTAGIRHTMLLGVDFQRSRFDALSFSGGSAPLLDIAAPTYPNGPFVVPAPYNDTRAVLTQTGFYLQDQIKWDNGVELTLGGRHDSADNTVDNRLDGTRTSSTDRKFTARAALLYRAPNGLAPYVSYTESFNPTATVDPLTNLPFGPETGKQTEVGLRYQPSGTRDLYSAALFDLKRQNYISYDANFMPTQKGEISVRGLELEAVTEPLPSLRLTAAYSYTPRAVVTNSSRPAEIGKQATAVPLHQLSLWGDHRLHNGIRLGLGARYVSATSGNGGGTPVKVPGYTLLDGLVGYELAHWSLALNLRNLTNKTYLTNCDTAAATCYYGDQRSILATATYRW